MYSAVTVIGAEGGGKGLVSACQQMRPLWLDLSFSHRKAHWGKSPSQGWPLCIQYHFFFISCDKPLHLSKSRGYFCFAYLSFQATTFLTEHRSKDTPRIKSVSSKKVSIVYIIMLICQTRRMKLLYLLIKEHWPMSFTSAGLIWTVNKRKYRWRATFCVQLCLQ